MFSNSTLDLCADVGDAGVEVAPAANVGCQACVPAPAAIYISQTTGFPFTISPLQQQIAEFNRKQPRKQMLACDWSMGVWCGAF